jgi:hypothetical protein
MVSHNSDNFPTLIFASCHSRRGTVASIGIRTIAAAIAVGAAGSRFAHPNCDSVNLAVLGLLDRFFASLIQQISPWITQQLFYVCFYVLYSLKKLRGFGRKRENDGGEGGGDSQIDDSHFSRLFFVFWRR